MGMTMSEIGMTCLSTSLLGFGTVFVVLIVIMFLIYAMKWIFSLAEKVSENKKGKNAVKTGVIENKKQPAVITKTDETELIAVLTAAAAVCMGKKTSDIIIRSYKRTQNNSSWNNQSIREQLDSSL